ncbi:DUF7550 family protein [Haloferacaceae archaeon DSL9]
MDDHGTHGGHDGGGDADSQEPYMEFRQTSPMQPFTTQQAMIGAVVLLVGLLVTFGLPLALL